jgi:uncharacterized protein (DUF4415 family)
MSVKNTGTVKFRLDSKKLPALPKKKLDALRRLKDDQIDYSDIPPQANVKWTRPGALVPAENKQQITLRLDADVVSFFKKTGKRYQSRINAALREYVNAQKKVS